MTQIKDSGSTIRTILCLVLTAFFYSSAFAAPPASPDLFVSIDGPRLYLTWNAVDGADGYNLFYAPYPSADPVNSIDLGASTIISEELPVGSAFYVALQSYNSDGVDGYSNIEQFDIQEGDTQPPQIDFFFGGAVTTEAESLIRNSTIRSEAFFRSQAWPSFSSPLTVHAYKEYDELVSAYASFSGQSVSQADSTWSQGMGGIARESSFWINVDSESWVVVNDSLRTNIMAHELFHILQSQLAGGTPLSSTPTWLVEGSAQYVGSSMRDWAGLVDIEVDLQHIREQHATRVKPTLADLETYSGFTPEIAPYQVSQLAVQLLTEDISDFVAFYSTVSNGTSWQDAFAQSFGRTIEAFYEEFASYQSNGYQP